jgi:streptogramin lyase
LRCTGWRRRPPRTEDHVGSLPLRIAALRKLIAGFGCCAVALVFASGAAARVGSIREAAFSPLAHVYLFGLAPGPDGNLWFPNLGCQGVGRCGIGRITPQLQVTEFVHGLRPGSVPWAITAGPDDDVWFTDEGRRPAIGRITPQGAITEFSRGLLPGSVPFEIAAGPGGDLWFTDQGRTPAIGRITPKGLITEFTQGLPPGSIPFGIAAAPDHQVWFTDHSCGVGGCAVGRVTASGRITELSVTLRSGGEPLGMTAGPDGNVWFADSAGGIGRITPSGQVTEFSAGLNPRSSPVAVAAGPDGNVWFTAEGGAPAIGRVTPRGVITEFRRGLESGSQPASIAPAADGEMWFTDEGAAAIGQVHTGAPASVKSPPAVAGAPRVGNRLRCGSPRWAAWARRRPEPSLFSFDGFAWLRDGVPLPGQRGRVYTAGAGDAGHGLSCRVTATYPPPFLVTVAATSPPVNIP